MIFPMESIWKEGEQEDEDRLEEISDVEDNDEQTTSVGNATSVVATKSWEPQYHRLHFPIDATATFNVIRATTISSVPSFNPRIKSIGSIRP